MTRPFNGTWWERLALRTYPRAFLTEFGEELLELSRRMAPQAYRDSTFRRAWDLARNGLAVRLDDLTGAILPGRGPRLQLPDQDRRPFGSTIQDLVFSLRLLRKDPGFTLVAIASLALGIGANTAGFSALNAALLERLPVQRADELVALHWRGTWGEMPDISTSGWMLGVGDGRSESSSFSYPFYERLSAADTALSSTTAFAPLRLLNARWEGSAELAQGQVVAGNYYELLEVRPLAGRLIGSADDEPAAAPVVVLSFEYWNRRFAADPSVVGRTLHVNGTAFTISGVTPKGFRGAGQVGSRMDLTMPLAHQAPLMRGREWLGRANVFWLRILGRTEAGSLERVAASVAPLFHSEVMALDGANPESPPELVAVDGSRGMTEQRSEARQPLWVLMAVVGSVLLIACTNLGNLLLARSSVRGREIAIRLSLGAGRSRLVRQLLTESLVLALLGGAVGLLLAQVSLAALGNALAASGLSVSLELDATVLTFTLVASVLTGLAFGIAPALRASRVDLTPALKQGLDRQSARRAGGRPLTKALLVVQVAISLLVLLTAGLFVRTLQNLYATDGGYEVQGVLLFNLDPALNGYDEEARVRLFGEVTDGLRTLPGVSAAAVSELVPLGEMMSNRTVHVPDSTATHERERTSVMINVVSPSFFDTFGIPMRAGRGFAVADGAGAGRVAIVNEAFAREYYPDANPVGRRLGWSEDTIDVEIVGVVADVAYQNLRDGVWPSVHVPYAQAAGGVTQMTLAMRVSGDPLSLTAAAREQVRQIDPDLPLYDVRTQRAQRDSSLARERVFASLSSMLGLVALGLASIGLYGMLSYSVARRTREIGVRIALGAQQGDIGSLVVRELLPVGMGILLGVALAWGVTRWLESMLYDLQPMDPLSLAAAIGLLAAVAALAAAVPAWRASRVDPVTALRFE